MYCLQHVFWRGAMALSLLVLGGVGAGVSEAPRDTAQACRATGIAAGSIHADAWREVAQLERARASARRREDA